MNNNLEIVTHKIREESVIEKELRNLRDKRFR